MKKTKDFIEKEQNLFIEIGIAILMIAISFLFKISIYEWFAVLLSITLVISSELINSSIERIVDIFMKNYNINAKIAKDTAAGAVFVSAILSIIVGFIIFLPKVLGLLEVLL